jgi:hypothetical protein
MGGQAGSSGGRRLFRSGPARPRSVRRVGPRARRGVQRGRGLVWSRPVASRSVSAISRSPGRRGRREQAVSHVHGLGGRTRMARRVMSKTVGSAFRTPTRVESTTISTIVPAAPEVAPMWAAASCASMLPWALETTPSRYPRRRAIATRVQWHPRTSRRCAERLGERTRSQLARPAIGAANGPKSRSSAPGLHGRDPAHSGCHRGPDRGPSISAQAVR